MNSLSFGENQPRFEAPAVRLHRLINHKTDQPFTLTELIEADKSITTALANQPLDVPGIESVHPRERQVIDAMSRGLSRAETGRELHVSAGTVHTYRRDLLRRLGGGTLAGITYTFCANGILDTPIDYSLRGKFNEVQSLVIKHVAFSRTESQIVEETGIGLTTVKSAVANAASYMAQGRYDIDKLEGSKKGPFVVREAFRMGFFDEVFELKHKEQ